MSSTGSKRNRFSRRLEAAYRKGFEDGKSTSVLSTDAEPVCCGRPVHEGSPEGYTLECCGNFVRPAEAEPVKALQDRVQPWLMACFGPEILADKLERGDRLLEEVFELLQSGNYPRERIRALEDYTYSREKGEPAQEVGGVVITLAAYCLAHGLNMHEAGEAELARIWTKVEKIRAKHAAKPTGSALLVPAQAEDSTGLSVWEGWDRSRDFWSETKHRDAVMYAMFRGPWSMEDAAMLLGFIDRTWPKASSSPASTMTHASGAKSAPESTGGKHDE